VPWPALLREQRPQQLKPKLPQVRLPALRQQAL
jgi:hypothetical protein